MPRRPLNKVWTAEDDQTIRDMAAASKSANLIAARLGGNLGTVRQRASMLGVKLESLLETRKRMKIKCGEALRQA